MVTNVCKQEDMSFFATRGTFCHLRYHCCAKLFGGTVAYGFFTTLGTYLSLYAAIITSFE